MATAGRCFHNERSCPFCWPKGKPRPARLRSRCACCGRFDRTDRCPRCCERGFVALRLFDLAA